MKNFILGLVLAVSGCSVGHDFDLTQTTPVSSEDAPYITVVVKSKIVGLTGTESGSAIRVDEVAPSKSFLVDFDENAFTRIIAASCDKDVVDLEVLNKTDRQALIQWKSIYTANIEISEIGYTISCQEH